MGPVGMGAFGGTPCADFDGTAHPARPPRRMHRTPFCDRVGPAARAIRAAGYAAAGRSPGAITQPHAKPRYAAS